MLGFCRKMIQFNISDPKFNFTIIQFKINSIQKIILSLLGPKKKKERPFWKYWFKRQESFRTISKLSRLSRNFPGYPETFWPSGKYSDYPNTFRTIRKFSRRCNFKDYAQKLSGRAKTFRMKCVNSFSWQKKRINRFRAKKKVQKLFLWQKSAFK